MTRRCLLLVIRAISSRNSRSCPGLLLARLTIQRVLLALCVGGRSALAGCLACLLLAELILGDVPLLLVPELITGELPGLGRFRHVGFDGSRVELIEER